MSRRKRLKKKTITNTPPFELTISEVSRGGAGLGRDAEGRAISVAFTAPGDRVKVRLSLSKQNYAEAELIELIEASALRQDPPCPVFTQCGGCQWQHLPYELQWNIKRDGLVESLRRVAIKTKKVSWDEYPAKTIWGYRNRIQLRKKGSELGFYSSQSHQIVPIQRCDIAAPEINAAITEIHADIKREGSRNDGQKPKDQKIELYVTLQGEVQTFLDSQHASFGFRQVNDEQNSNLQTWIKQSIGSVDGVFDLYGGSGNLSVALASSVSQIHCVDLNINQSLESSAENMSFHQSAVTPWLESQFEKNKYKKKSSAKKPTWLAIIDPPRSGLDKDGDRIIRYLAKLNVSTVILVGCKTDPWVRDISKFITQGWSLEKLAIFDFFPQTYHVESAALLTRK